MRSAEELLRQASQDGSIDMYVEFTSLESPS